MSKQRFGRNAKPSYKTRVMVNRNKIRIFRLKRLLNLSRHIRSRKI